MAAQQPQQPAIPPILQQLGFTPVGGGQKKRRLFITSEGEMATGKTHFFRTCPPPIVLIDFDRGLEGVCETDIWGNQILRKSVDMPDFDEAGAATMSMAERETAKKSYASFKNLIEQLCRARKPDGSRLVGTIGIDNGGDPYTLAQMARFGRLAAVGEVPAQQWTSMQLEFETIFRMVYDSDVNMVVTHRQGLKFKGLLGEKELKGYKRMQYVGQVHLEFLKRPVLDPTTNKPVKNAAGIPEIELVRRVLKCRQQIGLEGVEFPVVFLDEEKRQSVGGDFLEIAKAVLPMTTDEDWL